MKKQLIATILVATLVVVLGCMGSGGGGNSGGGGGGSTVSLTMSGMSFSPQTALAHAGDTVQWTNTGSLPHTVTSDTGQAGLDSSTQYPGGIGQNNVFTWTVPANATIGTHYFYHCQFHGAPGNGTSLGAGMSGEITVN